MMRHEYEKLISEVDKNIVVIREFWTNAKNPELKQSNMNRINSMLDERSRLTKIRDSYVDSCT